MASPTDVRLISLVELVAQKSKCLYFVLRFRHLMRLFFTSVAQIYETLAPLNGPLNHSSLAIIRRANAALDNWHKEWDELHRTNTVLGSVGKPSNLSKPGKTMDEDSLPRVILVGELHYAKLWLVCVALRGVSWDKMPFEQRELAFQGKDAASNCLSNLLNSPTYRAALRYAVHDSLVTAAFSALFLLKMAHLFPADLDLASITAQVEQLAQLLSEVAAERYAITLRVTLANLRRKIGLVPNNTHGAHAVPNAAGGPSPDNLLVATGQFQTATPGVAGAPGPPAPITGPFTVEELGFNWPADWGSISPSSLPVWIQEQSFTDLGLPANGSDSVFLQLGNPNGWSGMLPQMPEAR